MNQPSIKPAERERRHAHVVRRLRQLQREEDGWQQRWQAQQRQEQERSVLVEKVAELARKEVDLARQLHHVRAQLADLPELPPRDGLEGVGRSLIDESPRSALQNYAIFNIIVAIFNLFPIPPLDGYHCLAVVLHLVFGRRLSTRLKNAINLFGCLMMLVMLGVSVYFLVREVLGILLRGPEP